MLHVCTVYTVHSLQRNLTCYKQKNNQKSKVLQVYQQQQKVLTNTMTNKQWTLIPLKLDKISIGKVLPFKLLIRTVYSAHCITLHCITHCNFRLYTNKTSNLSLLKTIKKITFFCCWIFYGLKWFLKKKNKKIRCLQCTIICKENSNRKKVINNPSRFVYDCSRY